jgi:PAS domain S-box-containing protein
MHDTPFESAGELTLDVCRAAIELCAGAMLVLDDSGSIIMANDDVERLFDYGHAELIGRPVEILVPEHLRGQHAVQRYAYGLQPKPRRLGTGRDFAARRKDGSEITVEIGLNPIHIDGQHMVVANIVDVSERKRLARIKDMFIATLSHELRTPMTSIHAALGLLLTNAGGILPQPAAHLIGIAQANCKRLIRMTSNVLDLGKLEAGQMSFHYQKADACALVEKAIEANRALADDNKVGIRFDVPNTQIEVYVDPDRFMQVMTNLLSNAIKFSPPGEDVVLGIEARADRARITVRDRGPGIPAEFKSRVFEAFVQFDSDIVRKKGGSGLGLSIARSLVTTMHGDIGFDDAPGGGTIFRVELPDAAFFQRWQEEREARAEQEGPGTP